MQHFDIIINEGFQSNFLENSLYQLKQINIVFQYPSVSLTEAALEFAKVIPQFSESNEISLQINSNCIILSQGYEKIFEGLSQLKKLEIFKLQIGDRCLFDQDIFSYFMNASQELQNLQELSIDIFYNNILNKNSLKLIDQLKSMKNLQKLSFLIANQSSFQNEVLIQFYNGLSQLSSLKTLSINMDEQNMDDSISKQLGKTLQGLEKLENFCLYTNEKQRSKILIDVLSYLKYIPNLMSLEISAFSIKNQDVYEFIKNLKQLRSLKKIYLRKVVIEYKGKVEYQKSIDQIQNIFQNTMQLDVCDLSFINIDNLNDQLIQQLVSSIQHLQHLKELSLDINTIKRLNTSQDQAKSIDLSLLGIQIKHLNNLEKLNLQLQIKQQGFESLCEGIYSLENLKQLKFCIEFDEDKIEKKRFGMSIGNSLKNKNNLEQLILGYEQEICLEEAISITSSISHLINLKLLKIYLSQKINCEFIFMIYQSLTQLSRLENLSLSTNNQFREPQIQYGQIINTSFSFTNLINLETLEMWIAIQNKKAEEFNQLSDSFINMKNLKNLKLVLLSDYFKTNDLDYFANVLINLDNLLIMNLRIDFTFNINGIFFEKVFQNMKNLIKLKLSLINKMTEYYLNDLTNGFIYLKNLSQLHLRFLTFQNTQILDYYANMLAYLQNLSILELYYPGLILPNNQKQNNEKFLQQFGSLKKLNYFFGNKDLMKLVQDEINEKKIQLNNLIFISEFCQDQGVINYQNWQREGISHLLNLKQAEQDKQLQLKNIQTKIDKIIFDEKLSESQITNLILETQKYTYLEQLEILFQTDLNTQSHISLLQHTLSSFKFLQRFSISSQNISDSMKQLSTSLINAISLSLKSLIYLEKLTLKISKSNEKINLSEGIQSLKNLKQLNLSLNNFSYEDWIDFNLNETLISLKQLDELRFEIIDSCFSEKEAKDLSLGLINLKKLSNLSIIFGKNSQINEQGAKSISEAINHLEHLKLLSISVCESNSIGLTGTESIMGLESYLNKLQFLDKYLIIIHKKNNLTTQIFDKLQKLKEYYINYIQIVLNLNNVQSIEQLYEQYDNFYKIFNITQNFQIILEKNELVTTNFIRYLKEDNSTFDISLRFEENSQEDCLFLLNPLKNYSNLKSLSFKISGINLEVGQSFEKNIQLLQNLEEVKIENEDNGQNDVYILIANGLQKLVGLKKLEIQIVYLDCICGFIQRLEVLKELKHLYFQTDALQNQNQDQQLQIIDSLSKLTNLKYLFLNSYLENEFRSNLINCITKNIKRLVELKVNQEYRF